MHHGMVAIGLKAFTPTDRMAAILPHRDNCWGSARCSVLSAQCSVLTSHHACHSRTSTREYDYPGPVPECLRAATRSLTFPSRQAVLSGCCWGMGTRRSSCGSRARGWTPASQTERKIPFVGTWKGFTCAECLRAKALSMCQRGGHVPEGRPCSSGRAMDLSGGHVPVASRRW